MNESLKEIKPENARAFSGFFDLTWTMLLNLRQFCELTHGGTFCKLGVNLNQLHGLRNSSENEIDPPMVFVCRTL
ncbi:hypothetical protein SAMN05518848_11451 [Paenibacillus sp. PDC88]|nr:hypothetical protein SAMN05518848_11451 [Paenibacillus sp. PDC88]